MAFWFLAVLVLTEPELSCTDLNPIGAAHCHAAVVAEGIQPAPPTADSVWPTLTVGRVCTVPEGGGGAVATTLGAINELPWLAEAGHEADGVLTITTLVLPDGTVADTAWVTCTPDGRAPPTAGDPPTREEIWDSVVAAPPTAGLSPAAHHGSLVGFATGLWYAGPTSASTTVSLRGWTITAELTAVGFAWAMGSPDIHGHTRHTSSHPGGPDGWAAEHVYETSGHHQVAITVTWAGTATLTAPGLEPVVTELGQARLTSTVDYHVRQSVPVLTD